LRGTDSDTQIFADDCIIYRKILDSNDIGKLQMNLNKLGEWTLEHEMKINPDKSKVVRVMRARTKDQLTYYFGGSINSRDK
jgi:hypothetical protein